MAQGALLGTEKPHEGSLVIYTPICPASDLPTDLSAPYFYRTNRRTHSTLPNLFTLKPNCTSYQVVPVLDRFGNAIHDLITGEVIQEPRHWWYNAMTQTKEPQPCRKNSCFSCGIRHGKDTACALWLAPITHAVSLTQVGSDWSISSRRIRKVFDDVRETLPDMKWAYAIEVNPQGTGEHLHGYIYGCGALSVLRLQAIFSEAAAHWTLGLRAHVAPVEL